METRMTDWRFAIGAVATDTANCQPGFDVYQMCITVADSHAGKPARRTNMNNVISVTEFEPNNVWSDLQMSYIHKALRNIGSKH